MAKPKRKKGESNYSALKKKLNTQRKLNKHLRKHPTDKDAKKKLASVA